MPVLLAQSGRAYLEELCVGEWPHSVLTMAKTSAEFGKKNANKQLHFFTGSLKREFEEPESVKLASELSYMQQ